MKKYKLSPEELNSINHMNEEFGKTALGKRANAMLHIIGLFNTFLFIGVVILMFISTFVEDASAELDSYINIGLIVIIVNISIFLLAQMVHQNMAMNYMNSKK